MRGAAFDPESAAQGILKLSERGDGIVARLVEHAGCEHEVELTASARPRA